MCYLFIFLFICRTHNFSALKVVKSATDYTESALDEIRMLKNVSKFFFFLILLLCVVLLYTKYYSDLLSPRFRYESDKNYSTV